MTARRRWAVAMLRAVIRHAPEASREWASAMLRELDYIESDWAALWWALGSVAAICRHAGGNWRKHLGRREERTMNEFGKKTGWLFAGMGAALALGLAAAFAFHLTIDIFPSLRPQGPPWLPWVALIAIPQILFIVGLWRKRRPMAVGVLVMAVAMTTHFAIHFARHWNH
ncbi:MAG: hypothetical protein WA400_01540 [Silvibacterium sp.]